NEAFLAGLERHAVERLVGGLVDDLFDLEALFRRGVKSRRIGLGRRVKSRLLIFLRRDPIRLADVRREKLDLLLRVARLRESIMRRAEQRQYKDSDSEGREKNSLHTPILRENRR